MTKESEPMLKDVLNSLSLINGLLTNLVDRLSKVESYLNNLEQGWQILVNKVKDLEDSQSKKIAKK